MKMINTKTTLHKTFKFLALAVAIVQIFTPVVASAALSPEQIRLHQSGVHYFDDQVSGTVQSTCNPVNSEDDGKPVYMVGDSIGTQIQNSLPGALAGRQVEVNAVASRTLSVEPPSSGMAAVTDDQEYIKNASVVVVQLGTNSSGFTAEAVGKMIAKIRELSPGATIYWVDTAGVDQPIATTLSNVNSVIYSQATTFNYQVISWNKKVFGNQADPTNIDPNAPDNGYIRRADQFVHLTSEGVQAMTDLIATSIKNGPPTGANGCACTLLAGNDNAEKIWNFLITKGLTPPQAAGVMGNLQAESGFNPKRVEGGWGFPAEMDTMPPNVGSAGQPGYGIAQWTSPGRKQGLVDKATAAGKPVHDLGVQLDWLFEEATARGDWEKLLATTSAGDAAFSWHKYYEVSDDGPDRIQNRINFANALLIQYGSAGSSPSPIGASSC